MQEIVQDWLHIQKAQYATSKPEATTARRDSIMRYEKALSAVTAEAVVWRVAKAKQEKRIADLEDQLAKTSRDSGKKNRAPRTQGD